MHNVHESRVQSPQAPQHIVSVVRKQRNKKPFRPVLIAHETARQLREQTWSLKYGCFHTWARWLAELIIGKTLAVVGESNNL